ncbi:MAG: RDD family protein [Gemmatimonadota bacterium]|nr:RDD family protein [Gemmatimonadota bacterium]
MSDHQTDEIRTVGASGRVGFGRRLGALAVDILILLILTWIVQAVAGREGPPHASGVHHPANLTQIVAGVGVAVALVQLLYWFIEGLTGASPGKMVLKMRIGNATGTSATPATLILRMFIKQINVLTTFLVVLTGSHLLVWIGLAGGAIVFFGCFLALGASSQALHDRIVGTAVFRAGSRA